VQKKQIDKYLDQVLIESSMRDAEEERTAALEIINDHTKMILSDPDFEESLLDAVSKIRSGKMKWHSYDEVFR
jgi:hypothetical protein